MTLQNQHSKKGNNLSKSIFLATTAAILAIFLFISCGEVSTQGAPVKLKVVNASYIYSLAPQGGNTYEAWNMFDGNIATVWAVNLDKAIYDCDALYGPYMLVPCKKLSHVVIRNGYGKSASAYINNSRASQIYFEVETSDGLEGFGASLKDTPDPQRINAPQNESWNNNITEIVMVFTPPYAGGIIKGAKWSDLCITEIEFWGWK
jgi:hypothetical protein